MVGCWPAASSKIGNRRWCRPSNQPAWVFSAAALTANGSYSKPRAPDLMNLAPYLPLLIATHVVLAISLFLPSILLPFALRLRGGQWQEQPGRISRALFWLQRNGTLVIGAGLAVTGAAMLAILGAQLLSQ